MSPNTYKTNADSPSYEDLREKFIAVRARIRELELSNDAAQRRIAELESERRYAELSQGAVAACAWHAHRGHQPTQPAQPGYLECGCTIQEALFEESLARHGVGSIHPEGPMMEPAMRKPLLHLLQQKYNYVDGSLEAGPQLTHDLDQPEDDDEGNFMLAPSRLDNGLGGGRIKTAIAPQA